MDRSESRNSQPYTEHYLQCIFCMWAKNESPKERPVEPTSPPAVLARVGMEEAFLLSCILRILFSASRILKSKPVKLTWLLFCLFHFGVGFTAVMVNHIQNNFRNMVRYFCWIQISVSVATMGWSTLNKVYAFLNPSSSSSAFLDHAFRSSGWFAMQKLLPAEGLPLVPTSFHQAPLSWAKSGFSRPRRWGRTAEDALVFGHQCCSGTYQLETTPVWRGGPAVDGVQAGRWQLAKHGQEV